MVKRRGECRKIDNDSKFLFRGLDILDKANNQRK